MTTQYFITEAQRIEIINFLDKIAGTRPIANFLELQLPKQLIEESKEDGDKNKGD